MSLKENEEILAETLTTTQMLKQISSNINERKPVTNDNEEKNLILGKKIKKTNIVMDNTDYDKAMIRISELEKKVNGLLMKGGVLSFKGINMNKISRKEIMRAKQGDKLKDNPKNSLSYNKGSNVLIYEPHEMKLKSSSDNCSNPDKRIIFEYIREWMENNIEEVKLMLENSYPQKIDNSKNCPYKIDNFNNWPRKIGNHKDSLKENNTKKEAENNQRNDVTNSKQAKDQGDNIIINYNNNKEEIISNFNESINQTQNSMMNSINQVEKNMLNTVMNKLDVGDFNISERINKLAEMSMENERRIKEISCKYGKIEQTLLNANEAYKKIEEEIREINTKIIMNQMNECTELHSDLMRKVEEIKTEIGENYKDKNSKQKRDNVNVNVIQKQINESFSKGVMKEIEEIKNKIVTKDSEDKPKIVKELKNKIDDLAAEFYNWKKEEIERKKHEDSESNNQIKKYKEKQKDFVKNTENKCLNMERDIKELSNNIGVIQTRIKECDMSIKITNEYIKEIKKNNKERKINEYYSIEKEEGIIGRCVYKCREKILGEVKTKIEKSMKEVMSKNDAFQNVIKTIQDEVDKIQSSFKMENSRRDQDLKEIINEVREKNNMFSKYFSKIEIIELDVRESVKKEYINEWKTIIKEKIKTSKEEYKNVNLIIDKIKEMKEMFITYKSDLDHFKEMYKKISNDVGEINKRIDAWMLEEIKQKGEENNKESKPFISISVNSKINSNGKNDEEQKITSKKKLIGEDGNENKVKKREKENKNDKVNCCE